MSENWLIVGICGVTCGGKTTLANQLRQVFPSSEIINQDDYFFEPNNPRHLWIPEIKHVHYDILSSLDMDKMYNDILKIIRNRKLPENTFCNDSMKLVTLPENELPNLANLKMKETNLKLLIIEGFNIFGHQGITKLCDLKYFFTLNKEKCFARRQLRVYEPPDCPGYFERCVWPEFLKLYEEVERSLRNVKYFDENSKSPLNVVCLDILKICSS